MCPYELLSMKPWARHVNVNDSVFRLSCDPCPAAAAAAWEVIPCPRGHCKLLHALFVTGRWHGQHGHEKHGAVVVTAAVENRAVATSTAVVSVLV